MTDTSPPTVCVIVAAKDASATIGRAVASALAQPEVTEIVVVDDGSSDHTGQAALGAAGGDLRLRVITLERNVGPAAARNRALEATSADLVCILDADDFMLEGRIGRMLARFDNCDLLADDLHYSTDDGATIAARGLFELGQDDEDFLTFERFVLANISRPGKARGELGFLKPLMRRSFLVEHCLGYDPALRLGEDYALYARALAAGARFKVTSGCGYVSVVRPDSLSGSHTLHDLAALLRFDIELPSQVILTPAELRALRQHQRDLRTKVDHREVLKAKSDQKYGRVAQILMHPGRGLAVVAAIARDKLRP